MGIRFRCPNGHPLNVKDDFAGKRAICPKCKAKLVVPAAASGAPSTVAEPATVDTAPEPAQPVLSAEAAATATPPASTVEDAWHVRIASGEQFGPVDQATVQAWIEEGRVAANSWVWRNGWDDWKPGSEVIALLSGQSDDTTAGSTATPPDTPAAALSPDAGTSRTELETPASLAAARRKKLALRKKRQMKVTLVLVMLTAVLAVVLVIVLVRSPAQKEPDARSGRPVRDASLVGENFAFTPRSIQLRW